MKHPSNTDIDKLQSLILEFDKIIFKLNPKAEIHTNLKITLPKIKYDVSALQKLVEDQASLIYSLTPSSYLKGVVNSVLDSISVDDTLVELKGKSKKA